MPRYEYAFRLSPRAVFGLSQAGFTVAPVGAEVIGPTIDTATGNVLNVGSESLLRPYANRLHVDIPIETGGITFWDDVLRLTIDAESPEAARQPAISLLNELLPLLSFTFGHHMSAEFIQATDESGRGIPFWTETMVSFFAYNLDEVRAAAAAIPENLPALRADDRIQKALKYFAKGLAVEEAISRGGVKFASPIRPLGGGFLLTSEAYLNYWKVLETILGRSTESRAFDRRVSDLGLDRDLRDRLPELYRLRDAADVAHAERVHDAVGLGEVELVKAAAVQTLRAVLTVANRRPA